MTEEVDDRLYRDVADPAREAVGAILALLVAGRRRSRTVQVMPEPPGMRFEIIKVASGDYEAIAHVEGDGKVWLEGMPAAPEPGEAPKIGEEGMGTKGEWTM